MHPGGAEFRFPEPDTRPESVADLNNANERALSGLEFKSAACNSCLNCAHKITYDLSVSSDTCNFLSEIYTLRFSPVVKSVESPSGEKCEPCVYGRNSKSSAAN